jgi:hypothetical protein
MPSTTTTTSVAAESPAEPPVHRRSARLRPARALLALASLVLLLLPASAGGIGPAAAGEPRGRVILTVTGAIGEAGRGGPADFTLEELERLGTAELETETPFTPAAVRFTGVPLRTLMEAVGARGDTIRATALNDYAIDVPRADATSHGVLLATRIDGKPMPVRDKGPLWIVYPWRGNPELSNPLYVARSIWQLRSLEIR